MRGEDAERKAVPTDREQAERALQAARRPRRRTLGASERGLAARRKVERGDGSGQSDPHDAQQGDEFVAGRGLKELLVYVDDTLCGPSTDAIPQLTEAKRAEIEARQWERRQSWDRGR